MSSLQMAQTSTRTREPEMQVLRRSCNPVANETFRSPFRALVCGHKFGRISGTSPPFNYYPAMPTDAMTRRPFPTLVMAILLVAACSNAGNEYAEQYQVVSRTPPATPSASELVEYLHLEFGEDASDADALRAEDLSFFGTISFPDRTEHVWKFPCSAKTGCWVRVVFGKTGSVLMWSSVPPPGA